MIDWQEVAWAVIGAWLAALSWIWRTQIARIDKLESEKAAHDYMQERFAELIKQIDKHVDDDHGIHSSILAKLDVITTQITALSTELASLCGEVRALRGTGK